MGWAFAQICSVLVRDQKDFTSETGRPDIYLGDLRPGWLRRPISCALVGFEYVGRIEECQGYICNDL